MLLKRGHFGAQARAVVYAAVAVLSLLPLPVLAQHGGGHNNGGGGHSGGGGYSHGGFGQAGGGGYRGGYGQAPAGGYRGSYPAAGSGYGARPSGGSYGGYGQQQRYGQPGTAGYGQQQGGYGQNGFGHTSSYGRPSEAGQAGQREPSAGGFGQQGQQQQRFADSSRGNEDRGSNMGRAGSEPSMYPNTNPASRDYAGIRAGGTHSYAPTQQRYGAASAGGYGATSAGNRYGNSFAPQTGNMQRGVAEQHNAYPNATRTGHLGDWLSQHSSQTPQQREQLLRQQPGFNRLPQNDQQRLIGQMHSLNQMPAAQRDRRLARTEMLEKLSPGDRSQVFSASQAYKSLPADRQSQMKRAFQDLRGIPVDQRQTELNSARFQNNFSPQERSILGNLLRIEPYSPQR